MGELKARMPRRGDKVRHRILWFHPRRLLPPQAGGELRVTGLIDAVVRDGNDVLVIQPGSLSTEQPVGYRIHEVPVRQGLGLAFAKIAARSPLRSARITRAGRREAREEIANFGPDVAVVSDLFSWPLASSLMPKVSWILDTHNVETQLYAEFARHASGVFDRVTFGVDSRRVARQEPRVARLADAVVTVSAEDAAALQTLAALPERPVVVPSSVPTPVTVTGPATEPRMLFVGTLNHPPNAAAVRELATRILPRVRAAVPESSLVVVGRNATSDVRDLIAGADGAELIENAPELDAYYGAARCAVMPIRSGGGSRLKVYEALAHGLPVVGTERALSGIVLPGDVAITANSEDELVAAVIRVLTEDRLAAGLSTAARDCFIRRLSWEHAVEPLLSLIDELC